MTRQAKPGVVLAVAMASLASGCATESKKFGEGFSEGWNEGGVEVLWSAQAGPVTGKNGIVHAEGELCVTNQDGQVRFFNLADGEMHTAAELGEEILASGPCSKGTVAAVNSDATLLVTDLRDASRVWSKPLNGYPVGPLIDAGGTVISFHPTGETLAFSLFTGDELWRIDLPLTQFRFDGAFRPRLDESRLYMGTPEGSIYAIDILDGFVAWNSRLFSSRSPDPTANLSLVAGPSLADGVACASAFNGNTACFDAQSGRKLWELELSSASALEATGDTIYLVGQNGSLYALDTADGQEVFKVDRASSSRSPLVVAHGGKVVLDNGFSGISVHEPEDGRLLGGLRLNGSVVDIKDLGAQGLAVLTSTGDLHRLAIP